MNQLLSGKQILITRDAQQGKPFAEVLREHGADCIYLSCLAFKPIDPPGHPIDQLTKGHFDWIVFSSGNAGLYLKRHLNQLKQTVPTNTKLASIGKSTTERLSKQGWIADYTANAYNSEDFAKRFLDTQGHANHLLYPASLLAGNTLANEFNRRSVAVTRINLYEPVSVLKPEVIQAVFDHPISAITFFSASGVNAFYRSCPSKIKTRIIGLPVFAIGGTTAKALKRVGIDSVITADPPSVQAMVTSILNRFGDVTTDGSVNQ